MSTDSRERSSSSSVIWIVIVVVGLLAVLGVAAVAGLAYLRMQSAQRAAFRTMATMAVYESTKEMPVENANGLAQDRCEIFLRLLKAGEFANAYEQHTTRKFRQARTLAQFRQFLNAHADLLGDAEIAENQPAGRFKLQARLPIQAKETATLEMTWEDGDWKVDRLSVP